jgi:hypothetical protein
MSTTESDNADCLQQLVRWRFRYKNKLTGEMKTGSVTLEKGRRPDSKIAAIYGDIMDWEEAVTELKIEPSNTKLTHD